MTSLLPLLLLLPFIGAIAICFAPVKSARMLALVASVLTLLIAIGLAMNFDFHQNLEPIPSAQRVTSSFQLNWNSGSAKIDAVGFSVHLGVDSIALFLVLLTTFLTPLAITASFESIKERQKEYYAWMLALLTAMLGVFVARDLLLFYVFFELTLIPMFFIIGIWGGPQRRYAAAKFFLFTFAGSVFTLAGAVYLGFRAGSFDLTTVIQFAQNELTSTERFWLLLAFLAGFAVKVPLFPVHTWLPLAHTEAPTAGSVILAGVLLKLGTYGLLRLAMPIGVVGADLNAVIYEGYLVPYFEWIHFSITIGGALAFVGCLCVIGVIYGALIAWVQRDIKKLVAYSSVSHLGFCVLGLLALNQIGMQGSILYMINHGLSTGALFLVIGMIYDRFHTRDIDQLSGLGKQMPKMAFFFILFTMSSIGLPGTNGFVSEFLSILGAFTSEHLGIPFAAFAALGVILGAVYMLHMAARVIFGPLKFPGMGGHGEDHGDSSHGHVDSSDINGREIAILVPIAVLVIVLGILPRPMMNAMSQQIDLIRTPVGANTRLTERLPSPGTPGEGKGEGSATIARVVGEEPSPQPSPAAAGEGEGIPRT